MERTCIHNDIQFMLIVVYLTNNINGFGFIIDRNITLDVVEHESVTLYCVGFRHDCNLSRNGQSLLRSDDLPYEISCKKGKSCNVHLGILLCEVLIPTSEMTEKEHKSEWDWECYGEYHYLFRLILNLQVPVRFVYIKKVMMPSQQSDVTCTLSVVCIARRTRPAANITWYVDGQPVEDTSLIQTVIKESGTETYTTTSTLKLGKTDFYYQFVYCEAANIHGKPPVTSMRIPLKETISSQSYETGWLVDRYAGTIGIVNFFVIVIGMLLVCRRQRVQINMVKCCKNKASNDEDDNRVDSRQMELISRRLEAGYEVSRVRPRERENVYHTVNE